MFSYVTKLKTKERELNANKVDISSEKTPSDVINAYWNDILSQEWPVKWQKIGNRGLYVSWCYLAERVWDLCANAPNQPDPIVSSVRCLVSSRNLTVYHDNGIQLSGLIECSSLPTAPVWIPRAMTLHIRWTSVLSYLRNGEELHF